MRPCLALIASLPLLGACAHDASPDTAGTAPASTAQLLGTYWKLVRLGDRVIDSPPGTREIHMVLNAGNPHVTGFSGCNQMMGGYVLDGASLKFDRLAGTMMACVSGMDAEQDFLAMFGQVARWRIDGATLTLLDARGGALASFEARAQSAS